LFRWIGARRMLKWGLSLPGIDEICLVRKVPREVVLTSTPYSRVLVDESSDRFGLPNELPDEVEVDLSDRGRDLDPGRGRNKPDKTGRTWRSLARLL
jgi:hypothetical protein